MLFGSKLPIILSAKSHLYMPYCIYYKIFHNNAAKHLDMNSYVWFSHYEWNTSNEFFFMDKKIELNNSIHHILDISK